MIACCFLGAFSSFFFHLIKLIPCVLESKLLMPPAVPSGIFNVTASVFPHEMSTAKKNLPRFLL